MKKLNKITRKIQWFLEDLFLGIVGKFYVKGLNGLNKTENT